MDPTTMMMLMQMMQGQGGGQGGQGGQGGNAMAGGAGAGGGMGGGFGPMGGLNQFFSGMFGQSGRPYEKGGQEYERFMNKGLEPQNSFLDFGKQGMGNYQQWLDSQKDPSKFINNQMNNYQESPWAKYQQQQSVRAGQNAASAGGLSGSTPFAQQLQQNAQNISGQDQQQWLSNVLGINTQYGQGLNNQIGYGQHAADNISNMYGNAAQYMGDAAYGNEYGHQQDRNNMFQGGWKALFG